MEKSLAAAASASASTQPKSNESPSSCTDQLDSSDKVIQPWFLSGGPGTTSANSNPQTNEMSIDDPSFPEDTDCSLLSKIVEIMTSANNKIEGHAQATENSNGMNVGAGMGVEEKVLLDGRWVEMCVGEGKYLGREERWKGMEVDLKGL